jgi:hypothetical protein
MHKEFKVRTKLKFQESVKLNLSEDFKMFKMSRSMFIAVLFLTVMISSSVHAREYFLYQADKGTTITKNSDSMDHTDMEKLGPGDRIRVSQLLITCLGMEKPAEGTGIVAVSLEIDGATEVLNIEENSNETAWITSKIGLRVNVYSISAISNKVNMRIMKVSPPTNIDEGDPPVPLKIKIMRQERERAEREAEARAKAEQSAAATGAGPGYVGSMPSSSSGGVGTNQTKKTLRPGDIARINSLRVKLIRVEQSVRDPKAVLDAHTSTSTAKDTLREKGTMRVEEYLIEVEQIDGKLGPGKEKVVIKVLY